MHEAVDFLQLYRYKPRLVFSFEEKQLIALFYVKVIAKRNRNRNLSFPADSYNPVNQSLFFAITIFHNVSIFLLILRDVQILSIL